MKRSSIIMFMLVIVSMIAGVSAYQPEQSKIARNGPVLEYEDGSEMLIIGLGAYREFTADHDQTDQANWLFDSPIKGKYGLYRCFLIPGSEEMTPDADYRTYVPFNFDINTQKYQLQEFNSDYFQRLDIYINYAKSQNIIFLLSLFDGSQDLREIEKTIIPLSD